MIYLKWFAVIIIGLAAAVDLYAYIRRNDFRGRNLTGCLPGLAGITAFVFLLAIGIIGWVGGGSAIYMILPAIGLVMLIMGVIITVISGGLH